MDKKRRRPAHKTELVSNPSDLQRAVYALLENRSGSELAELAGIREGTLRRFLTTPGANMRNDTIQKLAEATGKTIAELLSYKSKPRARLVGRVGAGAVVFMFPGDAAQGDHELIDTPQGIDPEDDLEALEIDGDSMRPFKPGWRVFYRRSEFQPADTMIGKLCVVKVRDGALLIKEVYRGHDVGTYTLTSWNADPINDVHIVAAAPVLTIVPR
jgi:phage repressor protein C with HTH and peptisase S24 domain